MRKSMKNDTEGFINRGDTEGYVLRDDTQD